MTNRHPSTPPPTGHESIDPFFTTPMKGNTTSKGNTVSDDNSFNSTTNNINSHMLCNSSTNSIDHINTKKDRKTNHSTVLFTPQTPCVNSSYDDEYYNSTLLPLSPQTSKKNNPIIDVCNKNNQITINSLRTPETTPRHFYKKRDTSEILNFDNSLTSKVLFKNIRKSDPIISTESSREGLLEFRSSTKINVEKGNVVYEEDEEDEDDEDNEETQNVEDPIILDDREDKLMNYSSSEYDSDEEKNRRLSVLKRKINFMTGDKGGKIGMLPMTPPSQIMTEDKILKKHGIEKCKFKDLQEDLEQVNIDLNHNKSENRRIINPFIKQKKSDTDDIGNNVKKIKLNPRFENEIEMVYNPTGEKFFVKLSEEGKKIRPKRLNFEEFQYLEEENEKELLKTPEFQSENKMSIKGLLNYEDCNGSVLNEGVRYEKIHNPFRIVSTGSSNNNNNSSRSSRSSSSRSSSSNNNNTKTAPKGMKGLRELELINHTTGERKTQIVMEEEMVLKPRKLRFD